MSEPASVFILCATCNTATPHLPAPLPAELQTGLQARHRSKFKPAHYQCFACSTERHYGDSITECAWCDPEEKSLVRSQMKVPYPNSRNYPKDTGYVSPVRGTRRSRNG